MYYFIKMAKDLNNVGSTFTRMTSEVFWDYIGQNLIAYENTRMSCVHKRNQSKLEKIKAIINMQPPKNL